MLKHDINLNNDVSKEIVKQVAPEIADTFKKESATVKESTKRIENTFNTVSYTHLTLPTICSV